LPDHTQEGNKKLGNSDDWFVSNLTTSKTTKLDPLTTQFSKPPLNNSHIFWLQKWNRELRKRDKSHENWEISMLTINKACTQGANFSF
jgi:hypothetical protein